MVFRVLLLGVVGGVLTSAAVHQEVAQGMHSTLHHPPADNCGANPLFANLFKVVVNFALSRVDPVEASFKVYSAWEQDHSIFSACPAGVVTALVFLSLPQETEWKYRLLHKATYLLYSTPALAGEVAKGMWPVSDRVIRTLYYNSGVVSRAPLKFSDERVQTRRQVARDPGIHESVILALQHQGSVEVHFSRILFYHFYHNEESPCSCRTRSWCVMHWMRYFTNYTTDIWLASRNERKTLFRMDRSGCLRNTGLDLESHFLVEPVDVLFVFEINAFMQAKCRTIEARRVILYPTYDLSLAQIANFQDLGVAVLPDHDLVKPPNQHTRRVLDEAYAGVQSEALSRGKMLVFPADIRPLKGQTSFLSSFLELEQTNSVHLQRLKGVTIILAGACDGNQTYCDEVVRLSESVNHEGNIRIVLAGVLDEKALAHLYASSIGVVSFSHVDCNPRTIYEGLITNSPFFVTRSTRLSPLIRHLGHTVDEDRSVVEQLANFADFSVAGGFLHDPRDFANVHVTEAEVYRKMVQWTDHVYLSDIVFESVGAVGSS